MSYLTDLVNEVQNERNLFINFCDDDEKILTQYAKGKNEQEIKELIKTIW